MSRIIRGYRQALIEASIVTNSALAAYSLQQEFGANDPAGLQVVYGVYLLETRQVWAPHVSSAKGIGLTAAPRDPTGFIELANAILTVRPNLYRCSELSAGAIGYVAFWHLADFSATPSNGWRQSYQHS